MNRRRVDASIMLIVMSFIMTITAPLLIHKKALGDTVKPQFEVILDLPYGSGTDSVGKNQYIDTYHSSRPESPKMFQMVPDGTIWVLDNVNKRILAFKDGKQTREISTSSLRWQSLTLFGVTNDSIWVKNSKRVDNQNTMTLDRLDFDGKLLETTELILINGERFDPLESTPIGIEQKKLLLSGALLPKNNAQTQSASVVIDNGLLVKQYLTGGIITPGSDGRVYRFKILDKTLVSELPFALEIYDFDKQEWSQTMQGSIPRREELSNQMKTPITEVLGIDSQGNMYIRLYEGSPLSSRLIKVRASGEVIQAMTPQELGLAPAVLLSDFGYNAIQLMPDGGILWQYANPERYMMIRYTL